MFVDEMNQTQIHVIPTDHHLYIEYKYKKSIIEVKKLVILMKGLKFFDLYGSNSE
jgi:hypothetical protein